jgi:O-antigen ligase
LSAKESADSRKHKLEQSLELTLTHPLTGVGMGVFIPAAADMSKERGEHQDWLASHNSYTQISSETGVLGFLIIVAVFAVTLSGLLKLHRTARRLNLKEVQSMALCMLLSSIALSIHFFFDAIPYDFYLPMVAGLGTSLVCTARPLVAEAEASLRRNETTSESGLAQMAVPAGIAAGSIAKTPGRIPSSNPYKLGRSRAVNMK